MGITYSCDRCGFKTVQSGEVTRYTVQISTEKPVHSCTVDLCDKCIETAWMNIREQLFRAQKQSQ